MQWNLLCGNINQTSPSPPSRGRRFSPTHMRNLDLLLEEEEENQSKKERKQCWVRSWILERKTKGSFHQLLPKLAAHDTVAFESYMRMDYEHFSKIVDYLSERLHKKDTVMRKCVKLAEMCYLAIRSLFSQSVTALTSNTSCDLKTQETCDTRSVSRRNS